MCLEPIAHSVEYFLLKTENDIWLTIGTLVALSQLCLIQELRRMFGSYLQVSLELGNEIIVFRHKNENC